VLTIGKIGGQGKGHWRTPNYYSEQVVRGAEDYYAGKGEAPGAWAGAGAAALGLEGVIGEGELEAIFERRHPDTGAQLLRAPGEHDVKGIDLQMAVPKSVSTLWAVSEQYGHPEVGAAVWEATHGAGRAAWGYLERNACRSRAGAGGHIDLDGEGFVGAVFPHRFSREGDPQIHVHCLAANMTMCGGPDTGAPRAWRTLNAHHLYQHQKAAGYVFQAELRVRLTERLGVEWTDVHKGAAEVVGVPKELAVRLSKRSKQIAEELDRTGRGGSAREAELAALSTRRAKGEFDIADQRLEWQALSEEYGFGAGELAQTLDRTDFRDLDREEAGEAIGSLLDADGVTGGRSAFARRDLVEALAAAHGRGGSVQRIEELADRLIASDHIVALEGGEGGAAIKTAGGRRIRSGEPLLTTVDMLEIEATLLDQAAERVGEGVGVVELEEGFERRPSGIVLSQEQQTMVSSLVTSGDGVQIVRARAGTGKTTALDAARELWERDGHRVVGAALAARAADELRSRGGIESSTIHGLLQDLDRGGEYGFPNKAVLVVDEAGMVGTRMYRRLLSHAAQANVKVVLVGDERQLPSIAAGGVFEGLADRLGSIELTEVHRQNEVWDRQALDELRHGDISQWVATYQRHGRLVSTAGPDEQARALVEDWYVASRRDGMDQTLMLASRRHDVEALNQLARAARVAAGELDDTAALEVGGRLFTVGDRVMALRNTHVARADEAGNVALRNGNRGTVTEIDHLADSLGVRLDNDTEVVLDADYLQDGHLAHGYALTIHKSQGATVKQTFVLASPDLARELGYVASSRHTDEARFYINNGGEDDRDRPPEPGLEDQPLYEELERTLGHERAKALAFDETEADAQLGQLSTTELLEISERGRRALSTVPRQARRAKDVQLLERAASGVEATEQRLDAARQELAGLSRRERRQRIEVEQRIWGLGASLETGRKELAQRTDQAAGENIDQWLEAHEMALIEATAAGRELASRRADAHWRARRTAELDADPALEALLGERPEAPKAREDWERAAAAQESYRLQYGDLPAGHNPDALPQRQAADWHHAHQLADDLHEPTGRELAGGLARTVDLDDYGPDLGP